MNHLKKFRLADGLTQEGLARAAKVSSQTVYRAEAGRRSPRHPIQWRLLRALGVPWADRKRVFPGEAPDG